MLPDSVHSDTVISKMLQFREKNGPTFKEAKSVFYSTFLASAGFGPLYNGRLYAMILYLVQ